MPGLDTLEVAIGLAFLFFILSLVVTAAREMIEGLMQMRAANLSRGLREMLRDPTGEGLTAQIYRHPLINSLFRGTYDPQRLRSHANLPAYIPARNFAVALLDLSARGEAAAGTGENMTLEEMRANVAKHIPNEEVRRAVLVAIDHANSNLQQARANLEAWFDSSMDRVSGWYRKQTQWILLFLGLIIAAVLNVDTLRIAKVLYDNDALRSTIVAESQATIERAGAAGVRNDDALLKALGCPIEDPARRPSAASPETPPTAAPGANSAAGQAQPRRLTSCAQERLEALRYPVGWEAGTSWKPWNPAFPWTAIPGWLITAFALTLGAPFWFDLLNKIMVIRSTVKPHEKSPEEASEDRQAGTDGRNRRNGGR
jgi:hypothetical protein